MAPHGAPWALIGVVSERECKGPQPPNPAQMVPEGVGSAPAGTWQHPAPTAAAQIAAGPFLTVPGLPAPLRAQDQAPPEQVSWPWRAHFSSTSPFSFCGCCQPRSRFLSHFLGHHRAQQDPPVVALQAGGWFSAPAWGEAAARGAGFRPARRNRLSHSWLSGTKRPPQISAALEINSSPPSKSSALTIIHGSLYIFGQAVEAAQTIPPAGITRLVATFLSSRQRLCFIWPEKGPLLS